jgi:hypothetical protein
MPEKGRGRTQWRIEDVYRASLREKEEEESFIRHQCITSKLYGVKDGRPKLQKGNTRSTATLYTPQALRPWVWVWQWL